MGRELDSWREHLVIFEERVWPMFRSYGYSKDTAYIVWHLNSMSNTLEGKLDELIEEQGDWS